MASWLKDISLADIIVWFQYPEMADVGAAREAMFDRVSTPVFDI